MKCVIIDDEPLAIRVLSQHIKKTKGLELVKSFENAFEALYYIQTKATDLIFLDIQMPGVNGLQFIKILKYPPKIIITSAYKEYALEALETGVIDYLLKPIAYDRFLDAVSKAMQQEPAITNARVIEKESEDSFVFVKEKAHYVKVAERDMLFLHGDRNYCVLQLVDRKIILTGNLAYYSSRLSREKFRRIHKSYLVLLSRIEKYNAESVWINNFEIPIGRTYKQSLMSYLEKKRL
ncbi:response regulator transcription factor [Fulvivirgaceae bacterium BMA12]|uniref:Response regulator transcription factor n=1 Tax=Agaribacillus aureus TaxID=3051825 RepID=A0ABT8L5M1_9BACT|nr:response regulator transcription factor [Fulvivirgaceae bacterium BMA12]